MCRVLMYRGDPVSLDDFLYQPNNSLVRQAYSPQMMDMLSLAGFGMLGWETTSHDPQIPFSYRSLNLPLFDPNLKSLSEKLRVSTLIAHVRGVMPEHDPTISEQNLHPFRYKGYRLALAHNGGLARFDTMRFALLDHIRPEIARLIQGNTDSEWIYALLLSRLDDPRAAPAPDAIVDAVEKTFAILRDVRRQHDIALSSPVNLFISDGATLVAVRFTFDFGCYDMQARAEIRDSSHLYLSVWYTTGKSYGLHDGEWKMVGGPAEAGGSVLVSSEPLTRDTSTWFEVPEYSALIATDEPGKPQLRVKFLDV